MSKYTALKEFLLKQHDNIVPLTFADVERLTGIKLPRSAQRREWWSNNPNNSALTKAWLAAGFRSEQVDMQREKLILRRVEQINQPDAVPAAGGVKSRTKPYHPLFGIWKGMMRIEPGVDLTEPADPDWGKVND
jgi:hypothetical protein